MEELKNEIELVLSVDDVPQPEKAVKVEVFLIIRLSNNNKKK